MSETFPAQLLQKARLLHPVEHYYGGVAHAELVIPNYVLVFHRKHCSQLSEKGIYHHRWVLLTNLCTTGTVEIDRHVFRLEPCQGVLIFPHQFHLFRNFTADVIDWLFITFELSDHSALQGLRNTRLDLSSRALDTVGRMVELFLSIQQEMGVVSNGLALLAAELLEELTKTKTLGGKVASHESKATRERVFLERVHSFIFNHITEDLSLKTIARRIQISESHLRTLFQRHTGTSLGCYIRTSRLMKASGLLHNADMTISEIAEECGFSSVYSFSRAFRRAYSIAPSRFRATLSDGKGSAPSM